MQLNSSMDPQYEDDCCRLYGCFFGEEKETKYGWGIRKNVNTFETVVGVELLEGDKRAACDTCRYNIFLVKFHGEHLPDLSLVSDSRLPYSVRAL